MYAAKGWVGINIGSGKLGNFSDDAFGFDPFASFVCLREKMSTTNFQWKVLLKLSKEVPYLSPPIELISGYRSDRKFWFDCCFQRASKGWLNFGMNGDAMNGLLNSEFVVELLVGCSCGLFRLSISEGMSILRRFLSFILLAIALLIALLIAWPDSEVDRTGEEFEVAAVELTSGCSWLFAKLIDLLVSKLFFRAWATAAFAIWFISSRITKLLFEFGFIIGLFECIRFDISADEFRQLFAFRCRGDGFTSLFGWASGFSALKLLIALLIVRCSSLLRILLLLSRSSSRSLSSESLSSARWPSFRQRRFEESKLFLNSFKWFKFPLASRSFNSRWLLPVQWEKFLVSFFVDSSWMVLFDNLELTPLIIWWLKQNFVEEKVS